MRSLESMLPGFLAATLQDRELQRVLGQAVERLAQDKELTLEQLFPSTASGWGLELWERAWGIPVDRTQSDARRRDRILAKVKGTGTTTLEVIQGVAQSFAPWPAEVVEESDQYRFVIWYTGTIGEVPHKEDLEAVVNELKPAHLDWTVKYRQNVRTSVYTGCLSRRSDVILLRQVN